MGADTAHLLSGIPALHRYDVHQEATKLHQSIQQDRSGHACALFYKDAGRL